MFLPGPPLPASPSPSLAQTELMECSRLARGGGFWKNTAAGWRLWEAHLSAAKPSWHARPKRPWKECRGSHQLRHPLPAPSASLQGEELLAQTGGTTALHKEGGVVCGPADHARPSPCNQDGAHLGKNNWQKWETGGQREWGVCRLGERWGCSLLGDPQSAAIRRLPCWQWKSFLAAGSSSALPSGIWSGRGWEGTWDRAQQWSSTFSPKEESTFSASRPLEEIGSAIEKAMGSVPPFWGNRRCGFLKLSTSLLQNISLSRGSNGGLGGASHELGVGFNQSIIQSE